MNRFIVFILFVSLLFSACHPPKQIVEIQFKSIPVAPSQIITPDTAIVNIILPYKTIIDKEMTKKIAFSEQAIEKDIPDGPLNQLIADIVFYAANKFASENSTDSIDLVILNHGGIRKGLPKGDITKGNIYELMPFDNTISVASLKGETIIKMFNFLASKNDGHPISNVTFEIKNKKPENILINNKPIELNKIYRVATNDYLMSGNDGMVFFTEAIKTDLLPILIRDAIIQHITHFNLNLYKSTNFSSRITLKQ